MNESEFISIIDIKKYQVFIFTSPVTFPLNFAVHTWFVINLKGEISRWEFGRFNGSPHKNKIGVLKNFLKPTEGMNKFYWKTYPRFNSKLIDFVVGNNKSVAKKMAIFIEKYSDSYPLKSKYSLIGPNSNSFIKWILDKFPEVNMKLPINAIGSGYKIKEY